MRRLGDYEDLRNAIRCLTAAMEPKLSVHQRFVHAANARDCIDKYIYDIDTVPTAERWKKDHTASEARS